MTDSPSSRMKLRLQSLGSNVNTWGDTKLNVVLQTIDRATKGHESTAITADMTVTWSNYDASAFGQTATLAFTGSLSAAVAVTWPSVEWYWDNVSNASGQTITMKTSAGSGCTIPNGYSAAVRNTGSDCEIDTPTRFGGDIYAGGQIKNVTGATAQTDAPNLHQVSSAIAAASSASVVGTVKVDALASAQYLIDAVTASRGIALTDNGNSIDIGNGVGSAITGSFTPTVNRVPYYVDTTAANSTINVGGISSPVVGDELTLVKFGTGTMQLDFAPLAFRGSTTTVTTSAEGVTKLTYTGASRGFVEA